MTWELRNATEKFLNKERSHQYTKDRFCRIN